MTRVLNQMARFNPRTREKRDIQSGGIFLIVDNSRRILCFIIITDVVIFIKYKKIVVVDFLLKPIKKIARLHLAANSDCKGAYIILDLKAKVNDR